MSYYQIQIEPNDKPTIFDSKIGGAAYWTADKEYPIDAGGKKMFLLAQINFEQFDFEAPLPNAGLLQFFISDNDLMGLDYDNPTEQKNFRVVYHAAIDYDAPQPDNSATEQGEFLPVYGEYKISFCKKAGDGSEHDAPYHQILGRAFFTQDDPRYNEKFADYDTLLFQLDSEGEYVMWGDAGIGNFFINRRNLIAKNFTDILYNWDCC